MGKIYAVYLARLKEFYRDRGSLGWNFIFPFFIVVAFYFVFADNNQPLYKVGVPDKAAIAQSDDEFFSLKHVEFVEVPEIEGIEKVRLHKFDMYLRLKENITYWVNSDSQNAYFLERILKGSVKTPVIKEKVSGEEIPYIDWVIPGVLAMNIMFSCLWGVGWVVVKYRQEGYLKRLFATPLKAYQFLMGQLVARYVITFFVSIIVFFGCKWLVGFEMKGSYFDLFIVFTLGVSCLIAVGLAVACRTTAKELADGVLNIISWPMMLLSEVWFSIEGASEGIVMFANLLPLTHMVKAARAIMTEGAGISEVWHHVGILGIMTLVLLGVSAYFFKWNPE